MWIGLAIGAWVLMGAALAGWGLALLRLRRYRAVPPERPPVLGVYPQAFLCGGPCRTAQTALAALHLAGRIAVVDGRIVRTAPTAPPPADPVEAAALAACLPGRAGKARRVEQRAERSETVRLVADDLARSGLITHPRLLARIDSWSVTVGLAAMAVITLVAVAVVLWDLRHTGPTGRAAAIAAPALLGVLLPGMVKLPPAGPTADGLRVWREQPPPTGLDAVLLHRVAAQGLRAPGVPEDLARALRRPEPSTFQPSGGAGLGGL